MTRSKIKIKIKLCKNKSLSCDFNLKETKVYLSETNFFFLLNFRNNDSLEKRKDILLQTRNSNACNNVFFIQKAKTCLIRIYCLYF